MLDMIPVPQPQPGAERQRQPSGDPVDYPRTSDIEHDADQPNQWRRYMMRLLCWWPEDE